MKPKKKGRGGYYLTRFNMIALGTMSIMVRLTMLK